MIPVTRSYLPKFDDYIREISPLWESRHLTNMGPLHNKLQSSLEEFLKVKNAQLFTNGHLALVAAIKSLNLQGEVITTPFTFASTTNAIIECGLTPVFCDIDRYNYTIDASKIEQLITDKTCAIVPVHVYGNICDVEKIQAVADMYNLKVIYDAAHAFGVNYLGKGIGAYGDISMFSFHATKVFHTIEGGALTFNDSSLAKNIKLLRNFGLENEDVILCGGNSKMNEFQAAMGLCNLKIVENQINRRAAVFERYMKNLNGIDGLEFQKIDLDINRNYAYFPILIDREKTGIDREQLSAILKENGVISRRYFYPLTNCFSAYNKLFDERKTPIAKYVASNILCLPMFSDLSLEQVDYICKIIIRSVKK